MKKVSAEPFSNASQEHNQLTEAEPVVAADGLQLRSCLAPLPPAAELGRCAAARVAEKAAGIKIIRRRHV